MAGSFQTDGSLARLGFGFLTKLKSDGSGLVYSTFLAGRALSGNGIAVDPAGNAYVACTDIYFSFPSLPEAAGPFVLKLNSSGTNSGYIKALDSSGGVLNAIALDGSGNAYVTGSTTSPTFAVVNPIQAILGIGETAYQSNSTQNAIIVELDPSGNTLLSTLLGGQNNGDVGTGIATGPGGMVYIAGRAGSYSFPVTPGAVGKTSSDGSDAFVVALDPSNSCTFSLSADSAFPSSGGAGSVGLSTQARCGWFAISNQPWLTINSGSAGFGPAR